MDDHTPKAAKDKNCPYCGQAFTSSSLGRHLDLYIKARNPKRPDGIHDVEQIRRDRGGVTRRQPKGTAGRRNTSTPAATPVAPSRRIAGPEAAPSAAPSSPREGGSAPSTSAAGFPIGSGASWEAVNATAQHPEQNPETPSGRGGDDESRGHHGATNARPINRQAQKVQVDMRRQMVDAQDDARAAELALREFTNALRAARHNVEVLSSPFEFDPLSMDFPALTLRCLRPMPTLFASTQLPTPPSCWSTAPPGRDQLEALKRFITEEFRKFRAKCAAHAETINIERMRLRLPPLSLADQRRSADLAEQNTAALEKDTQDHLDIAYTAWEGLSPERKSELWLLELARGIATKQKDIERFTAENSSLVQENTNLKNQMEQLDRQQRPPEFSITAPAHMPMNDRLLFEMQRTSPYGGAMLGHPNAQPDYENLITSSIKRWKGIVSANRATFRGMNAQRPLVPPPVPPSVSAPPVPAGQFFRSRVAPPSVPMTFAVSTPASLAPTGGAQKHTRKSMRAALNRQQVRRGNNPVPTTATASGQVSAPATQEAPLAPVKPSAPPQPAQPVTTKTEPRSDAMDIEDDDDEEDEDDQEEEDEEEGDEEEEGDDDEEEGDDDEEEGDDDEDDDDDTTAPAQQAQTAPGASGGRPPRGGGGHADDNDDNDNDGESSDKDADAEMEDDGDEFAHMHTPLNMRASSTRSGSMPNAPDPRLNFSYTQNAGADQQTPRTAGNTSASLVTSGRLMPNMGLTMPPLGSGTMYME